MPAPYVFDASGTLGTLEIGSFIALFFFGVLSLQTYNYFETFPKDRLGLKFTVAFLWVLELVQTILVCHEVYRTTIVFYNNPAGLSEPWTTLIASIIVGGIINCVVQITFAIRIKTFAGSPWLTIVCCFLAVLGFVASCAIAAEGFLLNSMAAFAEKWGWLITTYMTIEAFVDILIAVSLCYFLKRHDGAIFESTQFIVNHLLKWTVQTGLVTSLTAIALLITFQASLPVNFVWIGIYTVLAKVYSNSLLASLNGRQKLRAQEAGEVLNISTGINFQTNSTVQISSSTQGNAQTEFSSMSQHKV